MLFGSPFKKYQKKLAEMYKLKHALEEKSNNKITPGSEAERLCSEIDAFIENDYALTVFRYYEKRLPVLIRVRTGEEEDWNKAFGSDFDKVSKSLRHSLVGLVEGGGRYKLKTGFSKASH